VEVLPLPDSRTPNGCRPLGGAHSRAPRDVEPGHGVSRTNLQRLTNDLASLGCFFNEASIRFKNQGDGLLKIRASFLKGGTLRIGTREFLDETDVPLGDFWEYRSQIQAHGPIIRFGKHEA
jgi:hypothetical protein